jgi:hypothetical protein
MNEMNIASGSDSYTGQRIIAVLVALPFTVFALMVLRTQLGLGFDPLGVILGSSAATVAIISWWFAVRGHIAASRAQLKFTIRGGLILGGIGFAAGFFGPVILQPGANQGPLLGIFFTGPLGLVLGAVIGWIYGRCRLRGPRPV